tara:strand:+ start:192 stop:524 length:333 start_codon:yes stop_codon:yes gene_type:complete
MSTINKVKPTPNRGVDFIINGGKSKSKRKTFTIGGSKMSLDIILVLVLPIAFLSFVIGTLVGWVGRDYLLNYREIPRPHPEMFDINGNLLPDEIVAFRFENNYDDNDDDE